MIQVTINNSLNFCINEIESIYNLKELIKNKINIDINNQILHYQHMILDNNKSLQEYNIKNNSNLILIHSINGGFDTLSLLMLLIYICAFVLYILILVSGLIPIIAHIYGYLFNWILSKIGNITGLSTNRYYNGFTHVIIFILSFVIVYYFVYALTSFITFPIMYTRFDQLCKSMSISNKIGFWVALFFIIIYGIFNIPNFILDITIDMTNMNYIVATILKPILGLLENFANVGKFVGIYAIPFLGTPFLEGYHFAVDMMSSSIEQSIELSKSFNCDSQQSKKNIGLILKEQNRQGTLLYDFIKNYRAENIVESLIIGLIPEIYNSYKQKVDNMPIWDKFGEVAGKFYTAKYVTKGFCFALKFLHIVANVLNSFGGSAQLANMIKTGNIGGLIGFVVFIICIILALLNIIQ
jgi:hypothetical protein